MRWQLKTKVQLALVAAAIGGSSACFADEPAPLPPRELQPVAPAPGGSQQVVPTAFLTPADVHDVVQDHYQRMPQYGTYLNHPATPRVRHKGRIISHEILGWFCYVKGNGPAKWDAAQ